MHQCFRKCRTDGAPLWLWMFFGSLVSWPNCHVGPGTIPALEIVDARTEEGEHKQMVVMVTQLTIKTKHLPVLVLAELVDERQKKLARETWMASLNTDRPGSVQEELQGKYYAVCSSVTPVVIARWATFERLQLPATQKPDKSGTAALDAATACILVHVAIRKNVCGVPGDFTLGHDVYEVLVLEPTGNNSFRRIGMGMVFDRIMKDFEQE